MDQDYRFPKNRVDRAHARGGRGCRLGGDDKAAITISGTSALDQLPCCLPERVPVVVAGPERPRPASTFLLGSAVAGGLNVNEAAAKIQALAATRAT
jgi:hypothetical protein